MEGGGELVAAEPPPATPVRLEPFVRSAGKLADGVTPRRETVFYVAPEDEKKGVFASGDRHRLAALFSECAVPFRWTTKAASGQAVVEFAWDRYDTILHAFASGRGEAHGFRMSDCMPHKLWCDVNKIRDVTPVPMEDVRERLGEELFAKLRPFQRTAVQFGAEHWRAYIADEMGCGKTLEAISICKYFEGMWPVVIVCPSILRETWRAELRKWLNVPEQAMFLVRNSDDIGRFLKKGRDHTEVNFLITSYALIAKEKVQTFLRAFNPRVCVLDECHYIKSMNSKRGRASCEFMQHMDVRVLLSGTPFNYPSEMYQQISALFPWVYSQFFDYSGGAEAKDGAFTYAQRYCKPVKISYGRREEWVFKGYNNSMELSALLQAFMMRRRKDDVLPQLPDKNRICVTLEPFPKKIQDEVDRLLEGDLERRQEQLKRRRLEDEKEIEVRDPSAYMECFRFTMRHKIPHVLAYLEQHIIGDVMQENKEFRALIFCHHSEMREAIAALLEKHGVTFFAIHKDTSSKKRQEYQDDFQGSDKYQVGLLSLYAASVGLTLTRADTVIFAEILFGPDVMLQAEDRVHRLGQTAARVNYMYLIQPHTPDESNFYLILKKERHASHIIDARANHLAHRAVDAADAQLGEKTFGEAADLVHGLRAGGGRKRKRRTDTLVEFEFDVEE